VTRAQDELADAFVAYRQAFTAAAGTGAATSPT
jgi:hypothetical protein